MSAAHIADVDRIRDLRIERIEPLARPADLLAELPLPEASAELVLRGRAEAGAVLRRRGRPPARRRRAVQRPRHRGRSASTPTALAKRAAELSEDLLVVMRVYFEKPRTTTGWKGLINDPHLDDSGDVNTGLRMARELLLEVLGLGLPVGLRVPRPDHAAVHRRHRLLGSDRRADDREPDPPPARLGPLDAGRLQERDRRRRPGRGRRRSRRRRAACVHRDRPDGDAGDPAHLGQPRRPRDPPRRPRQPNYGADGDRRGR